ncbi:MAG: serine--tRNA ligase [Candidatus Dormibacteria bacterium]
MISLHHLRSDPDHYREGACRKGVPAPIDEILALDERARRLRTDVEATRAKQHRASAEIRGRPSDEHRGRLGGMKRRIQEGETELSELDTRIHDLCLLVPNPPHESVPMGISDADNVTVRTWADKPVFDFPPLPHDVIGEKHGLFDFERAAKISGSRFAVLKGDAARLQRALITWMLDVATQEHGYTEILPPHLVRRESMVGTGQLPKFEDDAYRTDDDLFLVPTAEVPVTNLYREEILDGADLPICHVAYTACFRREAGSAGKDTRGYIRMHQFDKVEMVRFTTPGTSLDDLELLTVHAEEILQRLGIHYRVIVLCTGDMGFTQHKTYDVEAWAPGMERWLEVSSCSVFGDFQSRRANIRYRAGAGEKPQFVHTLNGSGLALPRVVDAVLETYQRADGTVTVPEVLRPYMGGRESIPSGR